jgi:transcriptional regulator with XRE-family HTH domain
MKAAKKQIRQELAPRIKRAREALQYSQDKMAQQLGITRTTLNRYEQAGLFPGSLTLKALVNALGISLNWLVGGQGPMLLPEQTRAPEAPPAAQQETAAAVEPMPDDIKELWRHMEQIPLLRYEILRCYHKFKLDHQDLLKEKRDRPKK